MFNLDRQLYAILACIFTNVLFAACPTIAAEVYPIPIGQKWGFIDQDGDELIPPRFDAVGHGELPTARTDKGWVRILPDGKTVDLGIGVEVVLLRSLSDDLFIARDRDNGLQTIDLKKKIPRNLAIAGEFRWGVLPCQSGHKWGYVDRDGKWIIEPHFDLALSFGSEVGVVRTSDKKWGVVSKDGAYVVKPRFDFISTFSDDRALVHHQGRHFFITLKGDQAFPGEFADASPFREGLARVRTKDQELYGFIDRDGKLVIENQFIDARSFSEGLVFGKVLEFGPNNFRRRTSGFFDRSGNLVFALPGVENARPFRGALARVRTSKRIGYVNKMGIWVWSRPRDEATDNW